MEEAETLATNVAIVSTKMLVTDTIPSLKASHGGLFTICAIRVPELAAKDAKSIVHERFSGRIFDYEDHFGQISFSLPHEKHRLGSIMKAMEELKGEVVQNDDGAGGSSAAAAAKVSSQILKDYTVTGPRLEEIFMNVVRRAEGNGLM
jgi:ATP-binding cassette, subfamily A (ABC1), member 3